MLKVVETFSGIGAQAKALERIEHRNGIAYEILNTSDWDIYAIIAYDLIHNGPQNLSELDGVSDEQISEGLKKYTLSSNGKDPMKKDGVSRLNKQLRRSLYYAINRTKNLGSITDIHENDLPNDIDVLTYSFPCQNLSIASLIHGYMSGIDRNANNRSGLLWEIERLLKERQANEIDSLPRFLLMENVTTLISPKFKDHFEEWKSFLEGLGYINFVYKLRADSFGIPQARERLFMISVFVDKLGNPENKAKLVSEISTYMAFNSLQDNKEYIESLGLDKKSFDQVVRFDYSNSIYKAEADATRLPNTPSRWKIVEKNPHIYDEIDGEICCSNLLNTITTRQDRNPTTGVIRYGEENDQYMDYRYLTPRECFLAMGFDEDDFNVLLDNDPLLPDRRFFSSQKLEKMAGNSIVVNVLEAIFLQINHINDMIEANSH